MSDESLQRSMTALAAADEPPPFELHNNGASVPLLLICDHAGNYVPRCLNRLGLPDSIYVDNHIAIDIGAREVTCLLADCLGAPALLANYSRLVIDNNRPIGDPTSIPAESDGVTIPGNQSISDAQAQQRADAIFWPYHTQLSNTIAHLWRHGPAPAVISIHSFTPEFSGLRRPWHIGVLWNHDDRLAVPLMNWLSHSEPELCIGDNQPYSGRDVAFSLERHAAAAGLPHVAIEIRQDLVSDPAGQGRWAQLLASALEAVLSSESVHQVQHF